MKMKLHLLIAVLTVAASLAQENLIELSDRRTYNSKTFYDRAAGNFVTRISAGHIHYRAHDGKYRDIDTRLQPARDGSYDLTAGIYQAHFHRLSNSVGTFDLTIDLPQPVVRRRPNPGRQPVTTRVRWKMTDYGIYDAAANRYIVIADALSVAPRAQGNEITYEEVFAGIDLRFKCLNTHVKEEIIVARAALPSPRDYNIAPADAALMFGFEFFITPANLTAYARIDTSKVPIVSNGRFSYAGEDRLEFEDQDENLHFFLPRGSAWVEDDSTAALMARTAVRRQVYTDGGKHIMLVSVPYTWLERAPAGTLIIDPSTGVAVNRDVWIHPVR